MRIISKIKDFFNYYIVDPLYKQETGKRTFWQNNSENPTPSMSPRSITQIPTPPPTQKSLSNDSDQLENEEDDNAFEDFEPADIPGNLDDSQIKSSSSNLFPVYQENIDMDDLELRNHSNSFDSDPIQFSRTSIHSDSSTSESYVSDTSSVDSFDNPELNETPTQLPFTSTFKIEDAQTSKPELKTVRTNVYTSHEENDAVRWDVTTTNQKEATSEDSPLDPKQIYKVALGRNTDLAQKAINLLIPTEAKVHKVGTSLLSRLGLVSTKKPQDANTLLHQVTTDVQNSQLEAFSKLKKLYEKKQLNPSQTNKLVEAANTYLQTNDTDFTPDSISTSLECISILKQMRENRDITDEWILQESQTMLETFEENLGEYALDQYLEAQNRSKNGRLSKEQQRNFDSLTNKLDKKSKEIAHTFGETNQVHQTCAKIAIPKGAWVEKQIQARQSENTPRSNLDYKITHKYVQTGGLTTSAHDRSARSIMTQRVVLDNENKPIAFAGRVGTHQDSDKLALDQATHIFETYYNINQNLSEIPGLEQREDGSYQMTYVVQSLVTDSVLTSGTKSSSERTFLLNEVEAFDKLKTQPCQITLKNGDPIIVHWNPILFSTSFNMNLNIETISLEGLDSPIISEKNWQTLKGVAEHKILHLLDQFPDSTQLKTAFKTQGREGLLKLLQERYSGQNAVTNLLRSPNQDAGKQHLALAHKIENILHDINILDKHFNFDLNPQSLLLPEEELLYRDHLMKLLELPVDYHCKSSVDRTGIALALAGALAQWMDYELTSVDGRGHILDMRLLLQQEVFKELFLQHFVVGAEVTPIGRNVLGYSVDFDTSNKLVREAGQAMGCLNNPVLVRLLPERYVESIFEKHPVSAAIGYGLINIFRGVFTLAAGTLFLGSTFLYSSGKTLYRLSTGIEHPWEPLTDFGTTLKHKVLAYRNPQFVTPTKKARKEGDLRDWNLIREVKPESPIFNKRTHLKRDLDERRAKILLRGYSTEGQLKNARDNLISIIQKSENALSSISDPDEKQRALALFTPLEKEDIEVLYEILREEGLQATNKTSLQQLYSYLLNTDPSLRLTPCVEIPIKTLEDLTTYKNLVALDLQSLTRIESPEEQHSKFNFLYQSYKDTIQDYPNYTTEFTKTYQELGSLFSNSSKNLLKEDPFALITPLIEFTKLHSKAEICASSNFGYAHHLRMMICERYGIHDEKTQKLILEAFITQTNCKYLSDFMNRELFTIDDRNNELKEVRINVAKEYGISCNTETVIKEYQKKNKTNKKLSFPEFLRSKNLFTEQMHSTLLQKNEPFKKAYNFICNEYQSLQLNSNDDTDPSSLILATAMEDARRSIFPLENAEPTPRIHFTSKGPEAFNLTIPKPSNDNEIPYPYNQANTFGEFLALHLIDQLEKMDFGTSNNQEMNNTKFLIEIQNKLRLTSSHQEKMTIVEKLILSLQGEKNDYLLSIIRPALDQVSIYYPSIYRNITNPQTASHKQLYESFSSISLTDPLPKQSELQNINRALSDPVTSFRTTSSIQESAAIGLLEAVSRNPKLVDALENHYKNNNKPLDDTTLQILRGASHDLEKTLSIQENISHIQNVLFNTVDPSKDPITHLNQFIISSNQLFSIHIINEHGSTFFGANPEAPVITIMSQQDSYATVCLSKTKERELHRNRPNEFDLAKMSNVLIHIINENEMNSDYYPIILQNHTLIRKALMSITPKTEISSLTLATLDLEMQQYFDLLSKTNSNLTPPISISTITSSDTPKAEAFLRAARADYRESKSLLSSISTPKTSYKAGTLANQLKTILTTNLNCTEPQAIKILEGDHLVAYELQNLNTLIQQDSSTFNLYTPSLSLENWNGIDPTIPVAFIEGSGRQQTVIELSPEDSKAILYKKSIENLEKRSHNFYVSLKSAQNGENLPEKIASLKEEYRIIFQAIDNLNPPQREFLDQFVDQVQAISIDLAYNSPEYAHLISFEPSLAEPFSETVQVKQIQTGEFEKIANRFGSDEFYYQIITDRNIIINYDSFNTTQINENESNEENTRKNQFLNNLNESTFYGSTSKDLKKQSQAQQILSDPLDLLTKTLCQKFGSQTAALLLCEKKIAVSLLPNDKIQIVGVFHPEGVKPFKVDLTVSLTGSDRLSPSCSVTSTEDFPPPAFYETATLHLNALTTLEDTQHQFISELIRGSAFTVQTTDEGKTIYSVKEYSLLEKVTENQDNLVNFFRTLSSTTQNSLPKVLPYLLSEPQNRIEDEDIKGQVIALYSLYKIQTAIRDVNNDVTSISSALSLCLAEAQGPFVELYTRSHESQSLDENAVNPHFQSLNTHIIIDNGNLTIRQDNQFNLAQNGQKSNPLTLHSEIAYDPSTPLKQTCTMSGTGFSKPKGRNIDHHQYALLVSNIQTSLRANMTQEQKTYFLNRLNEGNNDPKLNALIKTYFNKTTKQLINEIKQTTQIENTNNTTNNPYSEEYKNTYSNIVNGNWTNIQTDTSLDSFSEKEINSLAILLEVPIIDDRKLINDLISEKINLIKDIKTENKHLIYTKVKQCKILLKNNKEAENILNEIENLTSNLERRDKNLFIQLCLPNLSLQTQLPFKDAVRADVNIPKQIESITSNKPLNLQDQNYIKIENFSKSNLDKISNHFKCNSGGRSQKIKSTELALSIQYSQAPQDEIQAALEMIKAVNDPIGHVISQETHAAIQQITNPTLTNLIQEAFPTQFPKGKELKTSWDNFIYGYPFSVSAQHASGISYNIPEKDNSEGSGITHLNIVTMSWEQILNITNLDTYTDQEISLLASLLEISANSNTDDIKKLILLKLTLLNTIDLQDNYAIYTKIKQCKQLLQNGEDASKLISEIAQITTPGSKNEQILMQLSTHNITLFSILSKAIIAEVNVQKQITAIIQNKTLNTKDPNYVQIENFSDSALDQLCHHFGTNFTDRNKKIVFIKFNLGIQYNKGPQDQLKAALEMIKAVNDPIGHVISQETHAAIQQITDHTLTNLIQEAFPDQFPQNSNIETSWNQFVDQHPFSVPSKGLQRLQSLWYSNTDNTPRKSEYKKLLSDYNSRNPNGNVDLMHAGQLLKCLSPEFNTDPEQDTINVPDPSIVVIGTIPKNHILPEDASPNERLTQLINNCVSDVYRGSTLKIIEKNETIILSNSNSNPDRLGPEQLKERIKNELETWINSQGLTDEQKCHLVYALFQQATSDCQDTIQPFLWSYGARGAYPGSITNRNFLIQKNGDSFTVTHIHTNQCKLPFEAENSAIPPHIEQYVSKMTVNPRKEAIDYETDYAGDDLTPIGSNDLYNEYQCLESSEKPINTLALGFYDLWKRGKLSINTEQVPNKFPGEIKKPGINLDILYWIKNQVESEYKDPENQNNIFIKNNLDSIFNTGGFDPAKINIKEGSTQGEIILTIPKDPQPINP